MNRVRFDIVIPVFYSLELGSEGMGDSALRPRIEFSELCRSRIIHLGTLGGIVPPTGKRDYVWFLGSRV